MLSRWIFNGIYVLLLVVVSPWIAWQACRTTKYRQGWAAKLAGWVPRRIGDRPCLWLHAVSVGEVNLADTTLQRFRQRRPDWDLVVTTTTRTGYDLATRKYGDWCLVSYCPLDVSWAVSCALRRLRPTLLVLAELELWPNLIGLTRRSGAGVAIINGRLGDGSYRGYRRIGPVVRRVLQDLSLVAAQSEESAERFCALGVPAAKCHVTGSLKFDGVLSDREDSRVVALADLVGISAGEQVLLAGSTQAPEEAEIISLYRELQQRHDRLWLILVPRHPERFDEVAAELDRSGLKWVRRSRLDGPLDPRDGRIAARVVLVDAVGELGAWWGTATVGFVGGSFGDRGGQNMLEPAAFGVATSFGPNTWNFRDIVSRLLAAHAAVQVNSWDELRQFVDRALGDSQWAAELGARARELVASQQGATERTVDLLLKLLPDSTVASEARAAGTSCAGESSGDGSGEGAAA
jgi:3-deoxy-D-manno-octulosonic-acid transferase